MLKRKYLLSTLLLFCGLVLTACSGKTSVVLENTSCGLNCWRNIILGVTDGDEAVKLLQQMADVKPQSIQHFQKNQESEERVWASFQDTREGWMEITFLEGKAAVMYFYYYKDIPLEAIIRKFGEPKYIWPHAARGDPFTRLTSYFFYPEQGICLFHECPGIVLGKPETFRVTRATTIRKIRLVDTSISPDQLDDDCIFVGQEMESGLVGRKWEGYKAYPIP